MSLIRKLTDWLDNRTGYKEMIHEGLYENIPGGSKWRYVSGSMLVFAFVTQAITGIFLWMAYSPGSQNAWASVFYIQNEMTGGHLLRGVHHYMAQAMVVLLPLHLLQVVLDKAYKAPREINFWLGLVLMQIVLGLGLTGYLLPWDQKGYWATKVATELMSLVPFVGDEIQRLVVGGSEYGHATLTRFFALHAGVLPAALMGFLALHLAMFRKHGITSHSSPNRPDEYFWPNQVLKDAVSCLVMLAVVVAITLRKEAELGPPAEPTEAYKAARPEWYFLFLFQLLKKFKTEFIGAILVPGLVMTFLFCMPLIAKVKMGHVVNVVVVLCLVIGAGYLTYEAFDEDNYAARHTTEPSDPEKLKIHRERVAASLDFKEAKHQNEMEYKRIQQLVKAYGIRPEGPGALIAGDPEIQGPRLFSRHCGSCHSYQDPSGHGDRGPDPPGGDNPAPYGAPNLYGFASRDWVREFLSDKIKSAKFFGNTAHANGEMAKFVTGKNEDYELPENWKTDLEKVVVYLSAQAGLSYQADEDARSKDDGTIAAGAELFDGDMQCTSCHGAGDGPELENYGSAEWLKLMIKNPSHETMYGFQEDANDRMPAFGDLLSEREIDLLVRWIRGDDRDLGAKVKAEKAAEDAAAAAARKKAAAARKAKAAKAAKKDDD